MYSKRRKIENETRWAENSDSEKWNAWVERENQNQRSSIKHKVDKQRQAFMFVSNYVYIFSPGFVARSEIVAPFPLVSTQVCHRHCHWLVTVSCDARQRRTDAGNAEESKSTETFNSDMIYWNVSLILHSTLSSRQFHLCRKWTQEKNSNQQELPIDVSPFRSQQQKKKRNEFLIC